MNATLSEKTRVEWPVMLTLITCTAWISINITQLKAEVRHLAVATSNYDARLTALERAVIERGAQVDAIIESLNSK